MNKIIIDTDIGADCDDAGAIAIANELQNKKEIQVLGITHTTSDIDGAYTIAAINEYYSNSNIPIGQTAQKGFLDGQDAKTFTEHISSNYIKEHGERSFDDAVLLLRKLLSENTGIKLVCIGQLNNFAELLKSTGDSLSPMNGTDLVKKSVETVIIMGGDFRNDAKEAEYNIKCDIASARYVTEHCPVPIVYCGFEIGADVISGLPLRDTDEKNPVRIAYRMFAEKYIDNVPFMRPSWDLITVYYASKGTEDLWKLSGAVSVYFDEDGVTKVKQGGKDRFLVSVADNKKIALKLDELLKN